MKQINGFGNPMNEFMKRINKFIPMNEFMKPMNKFMG